MIANGGYHITFHSWENKSDAAQSDSCFRSLMKPSNAISYIRLLVLMLDTVMTTQIFIRCLIG